jgi:ribosome-interacting GTPase 1
MSTIIEKIKAIEDEMAKTQKNKATSYHLGMFKDDFISFLFHSLQVL